VTNAAPVTANPLTTSQRQSARWRFRVLLAVTSCYLFIAFAAPILIDEAGVLLLKPHYRWSGVDRHWLCGCTMLISAWVALGQGRIVIRALQGLIAASWLLLAWLLGLTMAPNWKPELELTTLACLTVAMASFAALFVVRRCTGKMLIQTDGISDARTNRFQYSLTTLFLVMFLICVTVALIGWIDPRYRNYAADPNVQMRWYLGVRRREMLESIWGESIGPMLIAAACLPVFLSYHRKHGLAWALGLLAVAFTIMVVKDEFVRELILHPLLMREPVNRLALQDYLIRLVPNLATVLVCLLAAATAMHWLGYRLAGGQRLRSANQLLDT
jgi:hypothetical protein